MKDKKFLNRSAFWLGVAGLVVSLIAFFRTEVILAKLEAQDEVNQRNHGTLNLLARRSYVPSNPSGDSSTPNP